MARQPARLRRILVRLLVAAAASLPALPLRAQEPAAARRPAAIVNLAGVDRVLDGVRWMVESTDRREALDALEKFLEARGGLKGLDRAKPLGAMLYFVDDRKPAYVGYVPVTNLESLMQTVAAAGLKVDRLEGRRGTWVVDAPVGPLFVRKQDGYAWVVPSRELLDWSFPDPVSTTKSLTKRFDLGVSLDFTAIPDELRRQGPETLRSLVDALTAEPGPDETEEQFRQRTQVLKATLNRLLRVADEGREFVYGYEFSRKRQRLVVEAELAAEPGSDLARDWAAVAATPTRLRGFTAGEPLLAFRFTYALSDAERKWLREELKRLRASDEGAADSPEAVDVIFDAILGLVEDAIGRGVIDVAIRFDVADDGAWTIVAATAVGDRDAFAAATEKLLDAMAGDGEVVQNAHQYRGLSFHRAEDVEAPPDELKLFGGVPSIHVGVGRERAWFALGRQRALPRLESTMDRVTEAGDVAEPQPILVGNVAGKTMVENVAADEGVEHRMQERLRKVFAEADDRVRVTLGTAEAGLRLRLEFGEGWVQLFGHGIADAFGERSPAESP